MNTKRIMSIGLALFINAGIITACSTTQMPGTVASQNPNSSTAQVDTSLGANVNVGSSMISQNTEPAPTMNDQLAINSEVMADLQDDETTTEDSNIVANEDASFSTKANDNKKVLDNANLGLGANLRPVLAKVLGRNQREKLLNDRENVLKAQIKVNEAKLKLLKDFKKFSVLKRKNVDVKNSDTIEIKNADGTTSKIKTVKFENSNNDKTVREDKVIKTYSLSGELIRVEHYLTVDTANFDRTYTKIVDYNNDGSKKVIIKSDSKWSDGRSRVVNKERNMDGNGNGTGTGTVVITDKDGKVRAYDFNVIITAGNISITPAPAPTPTAIPSPTPTASPVVSATASPTATASPAVSATI